MHAAPSSGGEDFDAVMGGAMSGRRDLGGSAGGGKAGGDYRAAEPPKTAAPKPAAKPREVAKREKAADDPQFETSRPAPPPPPQAGAAPAQKKMQSQGAYAQPQVTTSPPPSNLEVQNEGYQRYRNAPPVVQQPQPTTPPAANAQSAPELDETRSTTQGLVSQTRRQESKQATTSPEQLYSQLVTNTNNGNDCTKVMDLVKQLETWNYWSTQHPNEMRNAYLLRGRCQSDNNLANKDMENARRISAEQEKNDKVRASKAGKKAPAKSKAVDNNASQQAPAEAAPAKK